MRILLFSFLFLFIQSNSTAQGHRIPNIPDIPGYNTLLCDFHLHTVFSDGYVWPTVRVDEAVREGLDAIAITDHLEVLPHKTDIHTNHNRAFEIASTYASGKNVIVIPGTEITKNMPPGHFNALFIKDASLILNDDYRVALKNAAGQGAFIMWNHPGWKAQQPDTMRWWNEHTFLYEMGWLHGLEVVNYGEFYPQAVNWAIEKGLSIIGSSDQHDPFLHTSFDPDNHRPMTLVFATEKSPGGIRDALFNGRTAAYNGNNLIGREPLLKAIFLESVKISHSEPVKGKLYISNESDLTFNLILEEMIYQDWKDEVTVKPAYKVGFTLPPDADLNHIRVGVKNLISGKDSYLELFLSELTFNK